MDVVIIKDNKVDHVIKGVRLKDINIPTGFSAEEVSSDTVFGGMVKEGQTFAQPAEAPITPEARDVDEERDLRIQLILSTLLGRIVTVYEFRRILNDLAREMIRLQSIKIKHLTNASNPDWTAKQATRYFDLELIDTAINTAEKSAENLKAQDPIPSDYATNEQYWT